jgi:GxxExxY protein
VLYRNLKVEDLIIVDTMVVEQIHNDDIGQVIHYLKIIGTRTGLILNFKHLKLEWRKITYHPSSSS